MVEITRDPIDLQALTETTQDPGAGAVLFFAGTVRDTKKGRRVLGIDYQAYVPMALRVLTRIRDEMLTRWDLRRATLVHRVGRVDVGEVSVAIVVASPHRAQGFAALRHGIEAIKQDLPIWKRECFEDGEVWVQEGS